eukprot:gene15694-6986_t
MYTNFVEAVDYLMSIKSKKPIAGTVHYMYHGSAKKATKLLCITPENMKKVGTGQKKVTMSTSNHIEPAPDLRSERRVVGRQLAHIGDSLLESPDALTSKQKRGIILSLAVVSLAGVALICFAKDDKMT